MTQRVRVTVTGVTIAERSPLRLSLPPPSSGIWDVFAGDVAETSTFAQLLDTIRERHPLILSHFHAFRYAGNDWKRSPDLDIDSTVKAAVDGWPAFYNKFAREQRPLILPSESLELRIVVKQQRVAEIEQQVIAVEGQYWANFQAIKYLKSLAEMSESDTKLLKIHTNRLCGCVNSLKRMRDHWAVCLPSGCEQASSPTLITVPLSTWLSDMRCRLSERSRVPSTVDTHFLPHLQRLLNTPPPGFTSLWETNTEMVEAMSSTRYSPTDEVAHVKLDDYRRRKTIELDQITDEEIQTEIARQSGRSSAPPTSTSNGAHPPVSSSFLSSPLVQHALSQQYPNLTESAKRKTFKTVWSLLDDAARSPWWRRDAWLEKGKAAKRQDLSDHKSTRSDYSESTRFNDSESETVEAHGAGETAVPASESKAGEQTSASEDRPKRTEPTVTVRVPRGPFSFTITSGTVALWGQLPLIAYAGVMSSSSTDAEQTTRAASPASALDGPTTLPKRLTGGTILQHQFHYRSPARRGAWLVTPFHANTLDSDLVGESMEDDGVFVGWVVHHEDVDPGEAVSVLYINRYDWSCHASALDDPLFATRFCAKFADIKDEAELRRIFDLAMEQSGGNLYVVDGGDLKLDTVECGIFAHVNNTGYNREMHTTEWLFTDAERGDFGCQLSFADTEYELAWQIYEPRSTSPSQHEMVAMVYDAAYHSLDGDRFWVKKGGVGEWEMYPKGEFVSEELSV